MACRAVFAGFFNDAETTFDLFGSGDDVNTYLAEERISTRHGEINAADITPIGINFNRLDTQLGQTSDFGYPLRFGGELRFMPEFRFIAEMQINIHDDINDSVEAAAGINLPF